MKATKLIMLVIITALISYSITTVIYSLHLTNGYKAKIKERTPEYKIEITDHTKKFYKNEINKFDISIKSHWSIIINNVYATIKINDQQLKTQTYDIKPWEETNITTFWEAKDIRTGIHIASIKLHYGNKMEKREAIIKVVEKENKTTSKLPETLHSIAIILIVIAMILAPIAIKKKNRRKKKSKR